MSDYINVYEVGARDGLQNEATLIPTEQKLKLVAGMVAAGMRQIELTSFVHPKAVPQMADADEVMTTTLACYQDRPNIRFTGLVLNDKGYERAFACGCRHMALGVAASETFSQRNTRMSTAEALATCRRLVERARADGVWVRVYLMTAWVCPFEGPTEMRKSIYYAQQIWEMGIDELAIADTIGHAYPLEVGRLLERIGRQTDMDKLAVHLHDTQALGLANTAAALYAGVRTIDSSIGGLGGCPFAPGAAGNLATEDLAFLAYKMGIGTGIDFQKLWDVIHYAESIIGRPIGGRIRAWWESTTIGEPALNMP